VDRQNLGSGAVIGSVNFSCDEKFAATEALDGWAARLREFLDSAQELSTEDQQRADAAISHSAAAAAVRGKVSRPSLEKVLADLTPMTSLKRRVHGDSSGVPAAVSLLATGTVFPRPLA
jgi:hypothetical protein